MSMTPREIVHELDKPSILNDCDPGFGPGRIDHYFPTHCFPLSGSHVGDPKVSVVLLATGMSLVRRLSWTDS